MSHPYKQYNPLRSEEGPVVKKMGWHSQMMHIIGYEEAREILSDPKRFVKNRATLEPETNPMPSMGGGVDVFGLLYNNMLNADHGDHRRLRALVSKAFTNRRVKTLAPRIEEIAHELIDSFIDEGQIDLVKSFAFPLPIIVICELLGIPSTDHDKFEDWSNAFLGIIDPSESYEQKILSFVDYLKVLISERRNTPKDDLISALVHAEEDGKRLSEQELYSMVALLIVAGHETTVNLISNSMATLLQHPDQLQRLRENPDQIEQAIEEFLRHDGPAEIATGRYAAEDVTIGDTFIERGTAIAVVLAGANRDPAAFTDADQFDINRENNKHLAFGFGVHHCIGAPLARLEAKIAFTAMLQRLPDLELAIPADKIEYVSRTVVRGITALPIRWTTPA